MVTSKIAGKDNIGKLLERALDAGQGLLRLTPTWVPRSFLHPGKRIKLAFRSISTFSTLAARTLT